MTEALAACGLTEFTQHSTQVSTRLPTPDKAKLLRQPPVLPVLVSESTEAGGRAFKLGTACCAGERVHLILSAS